MIDHTPRTVRLEDYTPPAFLIDTVDLDFVLEETHAEVRATLGVSRNPGAAETPGDLLLDGRGLDTVSVSLDGQALTGSRWSAGEEQLVVRDVPERFVLETVVRLRPADNTSLEGLYLSGDTFCTQCEAEGFRKITWFLDRPDVMSRYTTRIVADRSRCPVLLSNGDAIEAGALDDGRHWVRWRDPFPKPSYLFALVAGDLACVSDTYTTRSSRQVDLRIYVEHHNKERCAHAMSALGKAMRWDEEVYGLEYDLDTYMIVAVDDFNMGAMENKGLNVFNSKYVLARPETATDTDYAAIEGVIAHEYFHNWTGNRVTCRDWFQLSLKEGLTVFRDQEFSADVTARDVKRVQDARVLRTHQFAEDAGPMAHPVRPDTYIEISNFYTVTIYNKGAEVVRMIHTLLGAQAFRAGMDLYFERHDGQAVTTEEFVRAMEDASGVDLSRFRRWYTQAGTPVVEARGEYDAQARRYELTLSQSCPATPGQDRKEPFHIPVRVGLIGPDGEDLVTRLAGHDQAGSSQVLDLVERSQVFRFEDVPARPVVSLGRGFSAPVRLRIDREDGALGFLMAHDPDPFNRWDAAQEYATRVIYRLVEAGVGDAAVPADFVDAFSRTLGDEKLDHALVAESLTLPAEAYLADGMEQVDVDAIHAARIAVRSGLARVLETQLRDVYAAMQSNEPYRFDAASAGRRALKNVCLGYLVELADARARADCLAQLVNADNMTDGLAALANLSHQPCEERETALATFEERWRDDPLVLDKWFTIQAMSRLPDTLEQVRELMSHPAFNLENPNRVRSLIGAFCNGNLVRFHDRSGAGYRFLSEQVIAIDALNPQLAARLLGALGRWRRFDDARKTLMRQELDRILATPSLSKDVYEIASKTVA